MAVADLGLDFSGNGNYWTPTNFSVTAGVGNDSLVDTPTPYGTDTGAGGEVRGNYATLNALDKGTTITLANGNLDATIAATHNGIRGTIQLPTSGKWYWEVSASSTTSNVVIFSFGVATAASSLNTYAYNTTGTYALYVQNNLLYVTNGSSGTSWGSATTANTVCGVAYDADNGKLYLAVGNTYYNSSGSGTGNPASGTNESMSVTASSGLFPYFHAYSETISANFGQRPFAYTAPSGFKALCTQNLPTPTIGATSTTQANRYFDIKTRTGTGATANITGLNFSPDFFWFKSRSNATNNIIVDRVRGAYQNLVTNSTAAETSDSFVLSGYLSDGYQLGSDGNSKGSNILNNTYVDWLWKANGAGSSNTAGTITSTVSANTTSGFSIVTYTGTGATGGTVGHGLGVKPSFIIVKKRSATGGWVCWHSALTGADTDKYIYLDTSAAGTTTNYWGSGVNSTTFGVWATGGDNNTLGSTIVAYCFAEVAGYSAFGSYTGNGSTDGPFVYCGFRPRWVMVKRTDTTNNWIIMDSSRDTYNVMVDYLLPNSSGAEGVGVNYGFDFLSNGFKLKSTTGGGNDSGGTYIYAAFAEAPFKYSLAR